MSGLPPDTASLFFVLYALFIFVIQYKPTKCTFSILILNYLKDLLHVLNPRVHLQEDGSIYSYGIVCFTCISVSILVGRSVCSYTLFELQDYNSSTYMIAYTDACKTHNIIPVYTTIFLTMNPLV